MLNSSRWVGGLYHRPSESTCFTTLLVGGVMQIVGDVALERDV